MRNGDREVVAAVRQLGPNLSPPLKASDATYKAVFSSPSAVLINREGDVFEAFLLDVLDSHGFISGLWLGRRDRAVLEPLEGPLRRRAGG